MSLCFFQGAMQARASRFQDGRRARTTIWSIDTATRRKCKSVLLVDHRAFKRLSC